jgi:2,3-bisphosphoglycerate-independent phosphoglycerate mutase
MSTRKTKYIVLVGDGMADYPLEELGGKTPLETAHTPHMDSIASCRIGLARTIPEDMEPGSDVANLSILGYDPATCHTGRAPLEAASMGVALGPDQVAFRMNLVNLDRRANEEIIMKSHSSGDISTGEASKIVDTLKRELASEELAIYPGVAYRHLLVWDRGPEDALTIPPHDVLDKDMAGYLNGASPNPVTKLIRRSWPILEDHPVNVLRRAGGLKEANSIWPWGQGKTPEISPFRDKFGLSGGVISAVDLLKGIGVCAGFRVIEVKGATGTLDTNYLGKAQAALKALETLDFVLVHVEAPDEAGHNGNIRDKLRAIEDFDLKIVGTILEGLRLFQDYRVMVISDHLTPIPKKTHTAEPTPFAWASAKELDSGAEGIRFTEKSAEASGLLYKKGHELMPAFLSDDSIEP